MNQQTTVATSSASPTQSSGPLFAAPRYSAANSNTRPQPNSAAASPVRVEEFIALLAVPAIVPDGDAATALERDARELIDQLGSD